MIPLKKRYDFIQIGNDENAVGAAVLLIWMADSVLSGTKFEDFLLYLPQIIMVHMQLQMRFGCCVCFVWGILRQESCVCFLNLPSLRTLLHGVTAFPLCSRQNEGNDGVIGFLPIKFAETSKRSKKQKDLQNEKPPQQEASPKESPEDIKATATATESSNIATQTHGEKTLKDAVKPRHKRKKKAPSAVDGSQTHQQVLSGFDYVISSYLLCYGYCSFLLFLVTLKRTHC